MNAEAATCSPETALQAVDITLANVGAKPKFPAGESMPMSAGDGQDLTKRVPLVLPATAVPAEIYQSICACAEQCFRELGSRHELFNHGGALVELTAEQSSTGGRFLSLHPVTPDGFRTRVEHHFLPLSFRADGKGGYSLKNVTVSKDLAMALLASREMQQHLPSIIGLAAAPILLPDGRIIGCGYDAASGWLVTGGRADTDFTVADAADYLAALLEGFDFATPGDRARALSAFFSPAFRFGRFTSRVPIDGAEADNSQSGKTYRQMVVAAVYGAEPSVITQRDGGVGSLDETFASRLHQGRPFVLFDNIRGKLDSQYLEAYMTTVGRTFPVRVPHAGTADIDPSGHAISLSSNGVEMTRDLANRTCLIRIRKRPATYSYPTYDGLPLLAYVQREQGRVLGAVYAILQDWITAGKPTTPDGGHDFREWASASDYIVQHYFGTGRLMDGHESAKIRVSDPGLTFIRLLALALQQDGKLGQVLTASDLFQACEDHGTDIPGLRERTEEAGRKRIGCIMRHGGLRDAGEITVDGFTVTREEREVRRSDGTGYFTQQAYVFTRGGTFPAPPAVGAVSPTTSTEIPPFSRKDVALTAPTAATAATPAPPPAVTQPELKLQSQETDW